MPRRGVVVRGTDGQLASANGEFVPASFRSEVYIENVAGGERRLLPLYTDKPMVFQVGTDWRGPGRKVRGVGVGHFVAIVPMEWTRWGSAPVKPEPCADAGFCAHYFHGARGDAPKAEGFEEFGAVSTSVIELVGRRVFDDSDQGELYVGHVPELNAPGMAWAHVGEEGRKGWRETYRLDSGQTLADVVGDRQGWFFVRVYREGEIVQADSVQFRYLASLREIRIDGRPYTADTLLTPGPRGHGTSRIDFVGSTKARVRIEGTVTSGLSVAPGGTSVACAPHPELGELQFRLTDGHGAVDVVIDLPRVWWRLERAGQALASWRDRSDTVTRNEYRALALDGFAVTVRVPARAAPVGFGFDEEGRVGYPGRREGRRALCVVSLRDFADHEEIDRRLFRDAVFGARCGEAIVDLMKVAADPLPKIAEFTVAPARARVGETVAVLWRIENCEGVEVSLEPDVGPVAAEGRYKIRMDRRTRVALRLVAPGMNDLVREFFVDLEPPAASLEQQPIARARRAGSWRRAKGFSPGEMAEAAGSVRLSVRRDRRRRSAHAINIASLEDWMNAQR